MLCASTLSCLGSRLRGHDESAEPGTSPWTLSRQSGGSRARSVLAFTNDRRPELKAEMIGAARGTRTPDPVITNYGALGLRDLSCYDRLLK